MSDGQGMRLEHAVHIAYRLKRQLEPHCHRIMIAGSIRRGKPQVNDIELVCEPVVEYGGTDLFGNPTNERVPLEDQIDEWRHRGVVSDRLSKLGHAADGPRMKRLNLHVAGGHLVPVDLFIVRPPASWGVIMTIRTGPGDFGRWLVTQRSQGGAMPDGWRCQDGQILNERGEVVPTPDEQDVFEALGLSWLRPGLRDGWRGRLRGEARA
jgi:DNA polymerase/3'-5' exonuclease PolX